MFWRPINEIDPEECLYVFFGMMDDIEHYEVGYWSGGDFRDQNGYMGIFEPTHFAELPGMPE